MNARLFRMKGGGCSCGGRCGDCADKKKRAQVSRMTNGRASQAAAIAPPIVHDVLQSPGEPLARGTRAAMEQRLGHDFSRVRVHRGDVAEESARAVDAIAYTVGHHVVLGEGANEPRVLAHELVHVVQQEGSGIGGTLEIGEAGSAEEREAERGEAGRRPSPHRAHIARQAKPANPTPSPSCTPRTLPTQYGCYCGAGSSCPSLTCTPTDSLDACCQMHDAAYGPCTFFDRYTKVTPCCYVTAVADKLLCECARAQAGKWSGDAEEYRQGIVAIFCNHPGCVKLPSLPKLPDLPKLPIPDIPLIPDFDWLPSLPTFNLFSALPPHKVEEAIA